MAKLKENQKIYIIQRLACFDTPTDVAKAVKEDFGIELKRQHVQQYDPTKWAGKQLSKKWVDLFEETRAAFLDDASKISIMHKSVRLARLDRMAEKAERMGNFPLAAQLMEQAAKECGGQYTNLKRVAPVNPDGKTPYEPDTKMTREERLARIAELTEKQAKA